MTPDEFLECSNPACRLRFPGPSGIACPFCKSQTAITAARYENTPVRWQTVRSLTLVFDNVRSAHNVGVMLRTAECAGFAAALHCGITPPADHPSVAKAALGSEQRLDCKYHRNILDALATLPEDTALLSLESSPTAMSLWDYAPQATLQSIAIVVGHEVTGIDPAVLVRSAARLAIPMAGEKNSLNVGHAFAIAAYQLALAARNVHLNMD